MPKKIHRLEVTPEAYLAMEVEAFLLGRTMKEVASDILLNHCSKEAKEIVSMRSQNVMSAILPIPLLVKKMKEQKGQHGGQTALDHIAERCRACIAQPLA